MMKLELIHKEKDKYVISMDVEDWYANLIRRLILREAPTLAIEDVVFKKNDSALYDEIIAHRLGLLVLSTPLKDYNFKDKCQCGGAGCSHCQVKFTLKEKGPKMVYAKSLKSSDPKVVPVYPDTPIVKLAENQELVLEATAILGRGREHAKWSPGYAYFKYFPEIKIGKVENPEEIVKACPKNIFEFKNNKLSLNEKKLIDCHLCNACVDESNGKIAIKENSNKIIFYAESWGQLKVKEMFAAGIEAFDEKLDEFTKLMRG